ncbi:MAG: biotin--[acetyl-CoA-carboxylase] ligase [Prevotella sp.]
MEEIKIIHINETDSTNRWMSCYDGEEGTKMTVVWCDNQTAGRGQGTNKWESEPGSNLTFSVKFHPKTIPADKQYILLQAAALAVRDTLACFTDGITIKWPNDIYYNDRKISGTLSECAINGNGIKHCIIGIGININQKEFSSDAPNPISLFNVTGYTAERSEILSTVLCRLSDYIDMADGDAQDVIAEKYTRHLYRGQGLFPYQDAKGFFEASIEKVEPSGHLVLRRTDGTLSRYAFKEVSFCIN